MKTLAFSPTKTSFTLEQNRIHVGTNRLLLFFTLVFFPILIISVLNYNFLQFRDGQSPALLITSIVVLSSVFFYIILRNKPMSYQLVLEDDNLKLANDLLTLASAKAEALTIQKIRWGMENGESYPGISIRGNSFKCITIGVIQPNKEVQKKAQCIDCTAYMVSSNEEWKRLINTLGL